MSTGKTPRTITLTHLAEILKPTPFALEAPTGENDVIPGKANKAALVMPLDGDSILNYTKLYGTSIHNDITIIMRITQYNVQKVMFSNNRVLLISALDNVQAAMSELTEELQEMSKLSDEKQEELQNLRDDEFSIQEGLQEIEKQEANLLKSLEISVLYDDESGLEYYKVEGLGFVRTALPILITQVCTYIVYCGKQITGVSGTQEELYLTSDIPFTLDEIRNSALLKLLMYPSSEVDGATMIWYEIILAAGLYRMDRLNEEDDARKKLSQQTTNPTEMPSPKPSEKSIKIESESDEKPEVKTPTKTKKTS